MKYRIQLILLILLACDFNDERKPDDNEKLIYRIPVVFHVIHHGEAIGVGANLSTLQIESQIRVLNEDFGRKAGTRGFNTHPDGADAAIEFELATIDPDGNPSSGIVRINADSLVNPVDPSFQFDYYAWYSYWDYENYLNIWTQPLPADLTDIVLGKATGPATDLPGAQYLLKGEPLQAEGILVNAVHVGESNMNSEFNLGRTITHEVGHYLGLLHTWGSDANDDYCDDTPPVNSPVFACPDPPPLALDGRPVMVGNYMNYTYDRCMNIFTKEQVARMRYVLENNRQALIQLTNLRYVGIN
ncbi:MAG: hypothetical protein KDD94_08185 [Calditrichaeota bacterium]|nr:hypothetical protein [Calditrichota bacterium]